MRDAALWPAGHEIRSGIGPTPDDGAPSAREHGRRIALAPRDMLRRTGEGGVSGAARRDADRSRHAAAARAGIDAAPVRPRGISANDTELMNTELFHRDLRNRRQLASLTPGPHAKEGNGCPQNPAPDLFTATASLILGSFDMRHALGSAGLR